MVATLDYVVGSFDRATYYVPVVGSLTAVVDTVARFAIVPFCSEETVANSSYLNFVVMRTNDSFYVQRTDDEFVGLFVSVAQLIPVVREVVEVIFAFSGQGIGRTDDEKRILESRDTYVHHLSISPRLRNNRKVMKALIERSEDSLWYYFGLASEGLRNDPDFFSSLNLFPEDEDEVAFSNGYTASEVFPFMGNDVIRSDWFKNEFLPKLFVNGGVLDRIPEDLQMDEEFVRQLVDRLSYVSFRELPIWFLLKTELLRNSEIFAALVDSILIWNDVSIFERCKDNKDVVQLLLSHRLDLLSWFSEAIQQDEDLLRSVIDVYVSADSLTSSQREGLREVLNDDMIRRTFRVEGPYHVFAQLLEPHGKELFVKVRVAESSWRDFETLEHAQTVLGRQYDRLYAEDVA